MNAAHSSAYVKRGWKENDGSCKYGIGRRVWRRRLIAQQHEKKRRREMHVMARDEVKRMSMDGKNNQRVHGSVEQADVQVLERVHDEHGEHGSD